MGISRLTAIEIRTNDVTVKSIGPHSNKKYGLGIYMLRDKEIHKIMLSVDYGYYNTKEEAITAGEDTVKFVRELTKEQVYE